MRALWQINSIGIRRFVKLFSLVHIDHPAFVLSVTKLHSFVKTPLKPSLTLRSTVLSENVAIFLAILNKYELETRHVLKLLMNANIKSKHNFTNVYFFALRKGKK